MVRILANGELVPDDDPRAAQSAQQRSSAPSGRQETNSNVHSTPPQADAAHQAGQTTSVFDSLNQRLLAAGLPPWNAGPCVVQPIVSVGFLLALLFMGIQGLIFAAVVFFVVNYSRMGGQGGGTGGEAGIEGGRRVPRRGSQGPDGARSKGGAFSGAGNQLGRS